MADIYLAYDHDDKQLASVLVDQLESVGWDVWWDRHIHVGESWRAHIEQELLGSTCIVVLWTRNSVRSRWVTDEAEEAMRRRVCLPITVGEVDAPLGFRGVQAARLEESAFQPDHPQLLGLLREIECFLASLEPVSPTPPKGTSTCAAGEEVLTGNGRVHLIKVPGGRLRLGRPLGEPNRNDPPEIVLDEFYIGREPVTVEQFKQFVEANPGVPIPEHWSSLYRGDSRLPATGISWIHARQFAEWAGGQLPSEVEWEYAARAGSDHDFVLGPEQSHLDRIAWYGDGASKSPKPGRLKEPNAWGLYDVLGNVAEWVEDDWSDDYRSRLSDSRPWIETPRSNMRVVRSACWLSPLEFADVFARAASDKSSANRYLGFRIVCH